MALATSVSASGSEIINGLLSGFRWTATNLTFSFPDNSIAYGYNGEKSSFEALDPGTIAAVRSALASYAAVSGLVFTELTGVASPLAVLRFADSDAPSTAWSYYPEESEWGGDVWFAAAGTTGQSFDSPTKGGYGNFSILHEL